MVEALKAEGNMVESSEVERERWWNLQKWRWKSGGIFGGREGKMVESSEVEKEKWWIFGGREGKMVES